MHTARSRRCLLVTPVLGRTDSVVLAHVWLAAQWPLILAVPLHPSAAGVTAKSPHFARPAGECPGTASEVNFASARWLEHAATTCVR